MKFTKILILFLGFTVLFSCKSKEKVVETAAPEVTQTEGRRGARAQRSGGGERGNRGDFQARQAEQQAALYTELGLSDAQKIKMEDIQKVTHQKMQAMRAEMRDGTSDRNAMRTKMDAIRNSEVAAIRKIMTEEQRKNYTLKSHRINSNT